MGHRSIWVLALAVWLTGCSRQPGIHASEEEAHGDRELPFTRSGSGGGSGPTASILDADIPAGTQIIVRLQTGLTSATTHTGEAFPAVLDQPILVHGRTAVARGTPLSGRILEAKASAGPQDPGYLRIVLTGMILDAKSFPLQTSSLFIKAGSRDAATTPSNQDVSLSADRKLTFRLTEAAALPN